MAIGKAGDNNIEFEITVRTKSYLTYGTKEPLPSS